MEKPAKVANPFSSRFVRPGAVPFLFPQGEDVQSLVERLRTNRWRGQIVGPHGSGKSSLLACIVPALERLGRCVLRVELHDNERRLPFDLGRSAEIGHDTIVLVDGYEQLSLGSRLSLKWFCRRKRIGLVVTTHASVGLPTLLRTSTDLGLAERIVAQLLSEHSVRVTREEIEASYRRRDGNLRELFFDLYDLYESRREAPGS